MKREKNSEKKFPQNWWYRFSIHEPRSQKISFIFQREGQKLASCSSDDGDNLIKSCFRESFRTKFAIIYNAGANFNQQFQH